MNIIIAGDFCPHDRVEDIIRHKQKAPLIDDVIHTIVSEADYSIVNLECPLINNTCKPIDKVGPNLGGPENTVDYVKAMGFKAVTLANNHFRDYGDNGVLNTLALLKSNEIEYTGGGSNLEEATKILFKTINNETIAFINCCEKEFSIASKKEAGSNPLDVITICRDIKKAKLKADYVVVIVHGGCEHYQLPTPRMTNIYRFFVEAGADAVVNHHQHCFSGLEKYQGKPIFYGLGNFCFDWNGKRNVKWNRGYMVELVFEKGVISYNTYPYIQCNEQPLVKKLGEKDEINFNDELEKLNSIISEPELLKKKHYEFAKSTCEGYQVALEPYTGRITRKLYSWNLLPSFWGRKKKLQLGNMIRCDSHKERLLLSLEMEEK